jgi:hypothetical protein
MADGQIHLREAEMSDLMSQLVTLVSGIREVSGTAYVGRDPLTISQAQSANSFNAFIPLLNESATAMGTIIEGMIGYLQRVIVEFSMLDLKLAVEAASTVNVPR